MVVLVAEGCALRDLVVRPRVRVRGRSVSGTAISSELAAVQGGAGLDAISPNSNSLNT
jgi:hypothetical protein